MNRKRLVVVVLLFLGGGPGATFFENGLDQRRGEQLIAQTEQAVTEVYQDSAKTTLKSSLDGEHFILLRRKISKIKGRNLTPELKKRVKLAQKEIDLAQLMYSTEDTIDYLLKKDSVWEQADSTRLLISEVDRNLTTLESNKAKFVDVQRLRIGLVKNQWRRIE